MVEYLHWCINFFTAHSKFNWLFFNLNLKFSFFSFLDFSRFSFSSVVSVPKETSEEKQILKIKIQENKS